MSAATNNNNNDREKEKEKEKPRSCTDVFALVLYVATTITMIVLLSLLAQKAPNSDIVLYGADYTGRACSPAAPFLAWPYPDKDCNSCMDVKICIQNCSVTESWDNTRYSSDEVMRICVPREFDGLMVSVSSKAHIVGDSLSRDLVVTWPILLCSIPLAFFMSFLWLYLVRKMSKSLVWSSLFVIASTGAGVVAFIFTQDTTNIDQERTKYAIGIMLLIVLFFFLLAVFWLKDRIELSVKMFQHACKILIDVPSLLIFPLAPMIVAVAYMVVWVYLVIGIFSISVHTTEPMPEQIRSMNGSTLHGQSTYETTSWDRDTSGHLSLTIFHMLWTLKACLYFTNYVISSVVSQWYFTPINLKTNRKPTLREPVTFAVAEVLRYHMGTIYFASIIISVIRFLRIFYDAFNRAGIFLEKYVCKCSVTSDVREKVTGCFGWVFGCVDCICGKITGNSVIWTAFYGHNLFTATRGVFQLLFDKASAMALNDLISYWLSKMIQILVALTTTLIVGAILRLHYNNTMSSIVVPLVLVFITAYIIAYFFSLILTVATDSIFLAFQVDQASNSGVRYLPEKTSKFIEDMAKEDAKLVSEDPLHETNNVAAAADAPVVADDTTIEMQQNV